MHPKYLHETAKNISIALATNFNISMETMNLPESWKEANVKPLQKKGPKNLVIITVARLLDRSYRKVQHELYSH